MTKLNLTASVATLLAAILAVVVFETRRQEQLEVLQQRLTALKEDVDSIERGHQRAELHTTTHERRLGEVERALEALDLMEAGSGGHPTASQHVASESEAEGSRGMAVGGQGDDNVLGDKNVVGDGNTVTHGLSKEDMLDAGGDFAKGAAEQQRKEIPRTEEAISDLAIGFTGALKPPSFKLISAKTVSSSARSAKMEVTVEYSGDSPLRGGSVELALYDKDDVRVADDNVNCGRCEPGEKIRNTVTFYLESEAEGPFTVRVIGGTDPFGAIEKLQRLQELTQRRDGKR